MTKEAYIKINETMKKHEVFLKILLFLNKLLTYIIYCAYPLLIIYVFFCEQKELLRVILTPGLSFIAVTEFRKKYDAVRPYELYETPSIIKKATKGRSFPSRHVFSVFVIGIVYMYFNIYIGMIFMIAGVFMAIIRVLGGVHFPKDVFAGAVSGVICGVIGMYLL